MNNTKTWWASKGVWGGIIAVGAGIAGMFGIDIDPEAQLTLAQKIPLVVVEVGGIWAIIGRLVASSRLTGEKEPSG